jgi:hypothetical protein
MYGYFFKHVRRVINARTEVDPIVWTVSGLN